MQIIIFIFILLFSAPVFAEGGHSHLQMPEHHKKNDGLVIGGISDFRYTFRHQDLETGRFARQSVFTKDTEIHVHFNKTSDAGFRYGGVIELEADTTAADRNEGLNADKTYLFIESGFGRIEAGSNSDAAHMMGVDGSTFATATGGIHGVFDLFTHFPDKPGGGGEHVALIHSPSLPLANEHGVSEDAAKISYFTPRLNGLQLGGSYIPDSGDVGTASSLSTKSDAEQFENVFNLAVNYETAFESGVNFTASVIGEFGNAEASDEEDLRAYAIGFNASYNHFTIGGSYGDWGRSMLEDDSTSGDGSFLSAGVAYEYNEADFSITYLTSEVDENELTLLSLGVDYRLAPGLTPYAEFNFFDIDSGADAAKDNNGVISIFGIKLAF